MAIDYAKFYKLNLMSKSDIANAVALNDLTAAQYLEITGEEYVAPEVNSVITNLQTEVAGIKSNVNLNNVGIVLTGAALLSRTKDVEDRVSTLEGVE